MIRPVSREVFYMTTALVVAAGRLVCRCTLSCAHLAQTFLDAFANKSAHVSATCLPLDSLCNKLTLLCFVSFSWITLCTFRCFVSKRVESCVPHTWTVNVFSPRIFVSAEACTSRSEYVMESFQNALTTDNKRSIVNEVLLYLYKANRLL